MSFSSSRLQQARRRRGLTKVRLAELAGLSVKTVTDFELGVREPTDESLGRLAEALRFPIAFFARPEVEGISEDSVSFRSMSKMTAGQRNAAIAASELALELNEWITARFDLPPVDVPDMRDHAPEAAAESVRAAWGLGSNPVRSMVHLLEAHGIRVFSLAERNRQVDAFSFWRDHVPFCFLNTMKSAEHGRLDAAHELGHLVLHRHGHPHGREAENEAQRFGSAFLMPAATVLATQPTVATISACIARKKIFGASLAAYVRRLFDTGRISDWMYRSLCIEIAKAGYRTREPEPTSHETSQVFTKVLAALAADGTTKAEIATELGVYQKDLDALMFGLVMTAVEGEGQGRTGRTGTLRFV